MRLSSWLLAWCLITFYALLIQAEEPVLPIARFNLDVIRSSPTAKLLRDFQASGSPTSERRPDRPSSPVVYDPLPSAASVLDKAAEPVSSGTNKFAPVSTFVKAIKRLPDKLQQLGKSGRAGVQRHLSSAVHHVLSGPVARRVRAALDPLVALLSLPRQLVSWGRLGVVPLRLRRLRDLLLGLLVRFAERAERAARRVADRFSGPAARPIFLRPYNKPKPIVPATVKTTCNVTEPTAASSPARVSDEPPRSSTVVEATGDARGDGMVASSVSGSSVQDGDVCSQDSVTSSSAVLVASAAAALPSGMATLASETGQGLVSEEAAMEGVPAEVASSSLPNQSSDLIIDDSTVPRAEQEAVAVVVGADAMGLSTAEDSVQSPSEIADLGAAEAGDAGGELTTVAIEERAGVPAFSEELDSEDGRQDCCGGTCPTSPFNSRQLLLPPPQHGAHHLHLGPDFAMRPLAAVLVGPRAVVMAVLPLHLPGWAVDYYVGSAVVSDAASALALPVPAVGHPAYPLSHTPVIVLPEPHVSAGPSVMTALPFPSSSALRDLGLLLPSTADLPSSSQPSLPQGAELALVPRVAMPVVLLPVTALPVLVIEPGPPAPQPDLTSSVSQLADSTARASTDGAQRAALPAARTLNASNGRAAGRDVVSAAAAVQPIFAKLSPSPACWHHDQGTPAAPTWRDVKTSVRPVVSEDVPPPPRQLHEADEEEDDVAAVGDSEPGRVGEDEPHPPSWSVSSLGWLVGCFTYPDTWSLERGVEYLRARGAALREAAWEAARSFVADCSAGASSRAEDMLRLVCERAKVFGLQVLDSVTAAAPAAKEAVVVRLGQGAGYVASGALRLWGFNLGYWRCQLLTSGARLAEYVVAHERTGRAVVFLGGQGEAVMRYLYRCRVEAEARVQASMQPVWEAASRSWTTTTSAAERQLEQAQLLLEGCWRRACDAAEELGITKYTDAGAAAFDEASSVVMEYCGRARAWGEPVVLSGVEYVSEQAEVLGRAASARCLQVLDSVSAVAPAVKEAVVARLGQGAGYVASCAMRCWGFTGGYSRGKLLIFGPRMAEYVMTHKYTVRSMAYLRVCGAAAARTLRLYKVKAEQHIEAINRAIWEAASRTWSAAAGGAERVLEQLQQQVQDVWRRACGCATAWTARAIAEVEAACTMTASMAVDVSARVWLWINEARREAMDRTRASLVDATQAVAQRLRATATELSEASAAWLVTWRSSVVDGWRAGCASVGTQAQHAYMAASELGSAMVRGAKASKVYEALLGLQGHGDVASLLGRARAVLKDFIVPLLSTASAARADLMQSWTLPGVVEALAEHPYGVAVAMAALLLLVLVLSFFALVVRARVTTRSSNSQQVGGDGHPPCSSWSTRPASPRSPRSLAMGWRASSSMFFLVLAFLVWSSTACPVNATCDEGRPEPLPLGGQVRSASFLIEAAGSSVALLPLLLLLLLLLLLIGAAVMAGGAKRALRTVVCRLAAALGLAFLVPAMLISTLLFEADPHMSQEMADLCLRTWGFSFGELEKWAMACEVVVIQALARGWIARRRYRRLLPALVRLQAGARGRSARKLLRTMKSAARLIEAAYLARSRPGLVHRSAAAIQAALRGSSARRKLQLQHQAALLIQALWRGHRARRATQQALSSILVLQAVTRAFLARRLLLHFRASLLRAQAAARGWLARLHHLRLLRAVLLLQALARSRTRRLHFLRLKSATVTFQAAARRLLGRVAYTRLRHAAVLLQSLARQLRAIKQRERALHAIRRIQAAARGAAARQLYRMLLSRQRRAELRHRKRAYCMEATGLSALEVRQHFRQIAAVEGELLSVPMYDRLLQRIVRYHHPKLQSLEEVLASAPGPAKSRARGERSRHRQLTDACWAFLLEARTSEGVVDVEGLKRARVQYLAYRIRGHENELRGMRPWAPESATYLSITVAGWKSEWARLTGAEWSANSHLYGW